MYWEDHEILHPSARACLAIERHNQQVLASALERVKPDVVSCWNMGALSMGMLATLRERDLPIVLVVCDDWLISAPIIDGWAHRFRRGGVISGLIGRALGVPTAVTDLGAVDAVCFASDWTRRVAEESTPWTFRRTTVTGLGIDLHDFPIAPTRPVQPWRGRLLFVGRVEVRKGIETLLRALAVLDPATTLEVLGPVDDRYRAHLDGLVDELGIAGRVVFEAVDRAELGDRYAAADAFVFPSEWAEPFGLVPIEAMACRCPVIASGTGGSGEFLRDGTNCLLFDVGDATSLAAVVRRLAEDDDLRSSVIEGGVRTASVLTTDRVTEVLEAWHLAAATRFADGEPPPRPLTV
jgi:glycosyltransferase involved in cell wall biosynthesis